MRLIRRPEASSIRAALWTSVTYWSVRIASWYSITERLVGMTAGLKRNCALGIAARRIDEFLEADAETLSVLKDLQGQIAGIARNVNQIVKTANRIHDADNRAVLKERRDLGKVLSRLDTEPPSTTETATCGRVVRPAFAGVVVVSRTLLESLTRGRGAPA
ncbi:DNA mobilization endonuclease VirD1/MobC family subunit [Acuticoccus sediminis]|nr:DNA mobilization endonuclease VirD1/MobC family subunit [Acuticoccus sediminis]